MFMRRDNSKKQFASLASEPFLSRLLKPYVRRIHQGLPFADA
jgi:hypothetical protein